MSRRYPAQSGPYSIRDARQHAWALLTFGPSAPPRRRPHAGMLPDVPDMPSPSSPGPSLFARIVARFRRSPVAGSADRADLASDGLAVARSEAGPSDGDCQHNERLAA